MSAGHFWAQMSTTSDCLALKELQESILHRPLEPLVIDPKQLQGVYCLAKFSEDNHYYRARVDAVMKAPITMAPTMMAQVWSWIYKSMRREERATKEEREYRD